ncbi:MAG TPA: glycerol-3-phosphate dehydrogenase/oxidase [Candidatus Omnitrophota bacterium]|nr:glycerol-3-phosphate dehydrogenase/oxidase [Candidatus Omnitrophota bacterium]
MAEGRPADDASVIRDIERFKRTVYDLLVIGGGINGAAIAHLAAKRGMKVALLEKGDFASGTSSKSTKLIHGGIRYLENLEFDLVYESLRERHIQLEVAPHLVKALPFVIPVYEGDKRPLWMMRLGVFLYDLLAGHYRIKPHRNLTREEVIKLEPGIEQKGLKGGVLYYDAQMDDARLCLENVLMAAQYGAHVANYVKVVSFVKENGRVAGVRAHDLHGIKEFEVRAKRVICAAGPWTNGLLRLDTPAAKKKVRTTKGIHIVYKGEISKHAVLMGSQSDRRIFFLIPWMGNSLIGTTDTDYIVSPDGVKVEQGDLEYLIRESKRIFPSLDLSPDKIIATFAALRPLIRKGGSASKVSRKHLFYEAPSGVIFVVGGKYTTYRKVAEDCMNRIHKVYEKETFKIYGSGTVQESAETAAARCGLAKEPVQFLMDLYGARYRDVLALAQKDPSLKERILNDPPVIKAQIVYSVETEMARTVEDITERRLSLVFRGSLPAEVPAMISKFLPRK